MNQDDKGYMLVDADKRYILVEVDDSGITIDINDVRAEEIIQMCTLILNEISDVFKIK